MGRPNYPHFPYYPKLPYAAFSLIDILLSEILNKKKWYSKKFGHYWFSLNMLNTFK